MKRSLATLVLVGALLGGCHDEKPAETAEAAKPIGVHTVAALAESVPVVVEGFGSFIAPPDHVAAVASATGGRVVRLLAKVGDRVRRGQPLVELLADPMVQADLAKARIAYEQARLQRERELALVSAGVAPRMRADAAESAFATAEADLALKRQAATIAQQNTVLTAPLSGVVTEATAAIGAVLSPQAPAMMVSDLSALWAEVALTPEALSKVQPGQRVQLATDAGAADLSGRVVALNHVLAQDTQRGAVRVALERVSAQAQPGGFVRARIVTGTRPGVVIPQQAVVMRDGQTLVYVVAGQKAHARSVETGERLGDDVLVASGLQAGERIVSEGAYDLADGADVTESAR